MKNYIFVWLFGSLLNLERLSSIFITKNCNASLEKVIQDFESNPRDEMYLAPFRPNTINFPYPYRILIYSPLLQADATVYCPQHADVQLTPSKWTSLLSKKGSLNPRLITCVFHNIILVQQYYKCNECGSKQEYLSCSKLLSLQGAHNFPYRILRRSIISAKLISFIFEQISHGMNFNGIAHCVANFHFEDFVQSIAKLPEWNTDDFYSDKICSYPTKETLVSIFLDVFQERRHYYEAAVINRIPHRSLSTDHTFRVAKNIGCFREFDSKFISEGMKLFVVMDSDQYIVSWKLTKSLKFDEIKDCLLDINDRMKQNCQVKYIFLDNCCDLSNRYAEIFQCSDVKLDLFHAVQRLTSILPNKKSQVTCQIADAIGLIFRRHDDRGKIRMYPTPSPEELDTNIGMFLDNHAEYISTLPETTRTEFVAALSRLSSHVNKGCLSGIDPGDGTASNERLHRLLNQSCLKGMSVIGPELAVAILTLLFYHHNSRLQGRCHDHNKSISTVKPLPQVRTFSNSDDMTSKTLPERMSNQIDNDNPLIKRVWESLSKMKEVCEIIKSSLKRRNFKPEDLMIKKPKSKIDTLNSFSRQEDDSVEENDEKLFHHNMLILNCRSFGLSICEVPRDGDCLFRSVLRLVHQYVDDMPNSPLMDHLTNIGICFANEDLDILTLRSLFVNEVKNKQYLQPYIDKEDDIDLDSYHCQGVFASNFGDLVAAALTQILQTPIFIICSNYDMSVQPFTPEKLVSANPLYLAYNTYESHYSSTVSDSHEPTSFQTEKNESAICKCTGHENNLACSITSTRCPCRVNMRECNRNCRCKYCGNNKESVEPLDGCKCRIGKDDHLWSCFNNPSHRNSRCNCLKAKVACTSTCACINCGNVFGNRPTSYVFSQGKRKRANEIPTIYKRDRGSDFLKGIVGIDQKQGTWTSIESMTLYCCYEILLLEVEFKRDPSAMEIQVLYNNVCSYANESALRRKSLKQIQSKLSYLF